jgi:hypothetical protein
MSGFVEYAFAVFLVVVTVLMVVLTVSIVVSLRRER